MPETKVPERIAAGGHVAARTEGEAGPLLRMENLTVSLTTAASDSPVVRDLSFDVKRGERVGVAGESGCGKTVIARALLGLLRPQVAQVGGRILLEGDDLIQSPQARTARQHAGGIDALLQHPMEALDPVRTVGHQLADALRSRHGVSDRGAREQAQERLEQVGALATARSLNKYPQHLPDGEQYRVMLAAALIGEPKLLVADLPTNLDRATLIDLADLLAELTGQTGAGLLMLTRDAGIITRTCTRIVTLYAGALLENARVDDAVYRPAHPYTAALLQSSSFHDNSHPGPPSAPIPSGCSFRDRCPHAIAGCEQFQPLVVDQRGRRARCWRHGELNLRVSVAT